VAGVAPCGRRCVELHSRRLGAGSERVIDAAGRSSEWLWLGVDGARWGQSGRRG